jgi:hypothetical protein
VTPPLLANIYLHWFDLVFHSEQEPATSLSPQELAYAERNFVTRAAQNGINDGYPAGEIRFVPEFLHSLERSTTGAEGSNQAPSSASLRAPHNRRSNSRYKED